MTTATAATESYLLDLGCPAALLDEAYAFLVRGRQVLRTLHGPDAPVSRVEDVLAECLDDPIGVVVSGAADDPLGDLDGPAREFAARVAAERGGASC